MGSSDSITWGSGSGLAIGSSSTRSAGGGREVMVWLDIERKFTIFRKQGQLLEMTLAWSPSLLVRWRFLEALVQRRNLVQFNSRAE